MAGHADIEERGKLRPQPQVNLAEDDFLPGVGAGGEQDRCSGGHAELGQDGGKVAPRGAGLRGIVKFHTAREADAVFRDAEGFPAVGVGLLLHAKDVELVEKRGGEKLHHPVSATPSAARVGR